MGSSVLTGLEAIEYATARGLKLNRYADCAGNARTELTVVEAQEIAEQDANLIWVSVDRLEEPAAT